jgi:phytoene dehydrogenase-like protein
MASAFKPPATQRVYDVCVVGGGVGGAAAGALLSRRGFRVLLIDEGGASPTVADGGWLFPSGPALRRPLRALPAAEALLTDLGLATDATRTTAPLDPPLQVLLPRHRLDLVAGAAALGRELQREWPADAASLAEALARLATAAELGGALLKEAPPLPPSGWLDRWTLRRVLRRAARETGLDAALLSEPSPLATLADAPLAAALTGLCGFLGRLDGPPSAFALARLAGVALEGLHRPVAGAAGLEEGLRRRIAETRGELLGSAAEPARIEAIGVERGRLSTVRVSGTTDPRLARAFIVATPLARIAELLPAEARGKAVARALATVRPGARLIGCHLLLRSGARPPGLGDAALLLDAGGTAAAAILVELSPARREPRRGAPVEVAADHLTASAFTLLPSGGDQVAARARLGRALDAAFPFLERHLVHRAAPPPVEHLLRFQATTPLGGGGLPVQGPWRNAFLASGEVLPGLGLEGELFAGLQAAAHVGALLGTKGRPRS